MANNFKQVSFRRNRDWQRKLVEGIEEMIIVLNDEDISPNSPITRDNTDENLSHQILNAIHTTEREGSKLRPIFRHVQSIYIVRTMTELVRELEEYKAPKAVFLGPEIAKNKFTDSETNRIVYGPMEALNIAGIINLALYPGVRFTYGLVNSGIGLVSALTNSISRLNLKGELREQKDRMCSERYNAHYIYPLFQSSDHCCLIEVGWGSILQRVNEVAIPSIGEPLAG